MADGAWRRGGNVRLKSFPCDPVECYLLCVRTRFTILFCFRFVVFPRGFRLSIFIASNITSVWHKLSLYFHVYFCESRVVHASPGCVAPRVFRSYRESSRCITWLDCNIFFHNVSAWLSHVLLCEEKIERSRRSYTLGKTNYEIRLLVYIWIEKNREKF